MRSFFCYEWSEREILKEKQCDICLAWFYERQLKDGLCKDCIIDVMQAPGSMSKEEKVDYVKKVKQKFVPNKYKTLSLADKKKIRMCEKCEWLRVIDYFKCKVYCSNPVCKRWK